MTVETISASVGIDTTDLKRGLEGAQKTLDNFTRSIKSQGEQMSASAKAFMAGLNQEAAATKRVTEAKQQALAFDRELRAAKAQLTAVLSGEGEAAEKVAGKYNLLGAAQQKQLISVKEQITAQKVLQTAELKSAEDAEKAAVIQIAAAAQAAAALKAAESRTLSSRLGRFGNAASNAGQNLSMSVTTPLTLIGGAAIAETARFEGALLQLQAATGANAAQMAILSARAQALGADLSLPGTSARTAAEAELELARAGMNVRDVFEAVRPAMQLSAATHISNAEAARILAVTENQFGVAAKDSVRAADLLTAAGNRTVGGVKALFEGLKLVGPVMTGLRIPIGDAVTSLALLNKNGMLGSMAGSALKTSLSLLADPSKKAREVLAALGISLFDARGQFIGMGAASEVLHEKLGKLTDQQRLMAEHALGGTRAMLALNILAREGAAGFDAMAAKVNKAGEAHRQAAEQMKGLPGAIKAVQTAFQAAEVAAIEPVKNALAALLFKISDLLTAFTKLSPGARLAWAGIAAGVAALGPVLYGIGQLSLGLKALLPVFALVRTAALATWAAIGGPATIALAIAGAAIAGFAVLWVNDWLNIQETFKAVWDTITQIFNTVLPSIQTAWTAFTDLLSGNWSAAWDNMKATVVNVLGFLKQAITDPIGLIKELVAQFGENFGQEMISKAANAPQIAAPSPNVLGPSGTHPNFAAGGIVNPALAAIGDHTKKAAEPTSNLNDSLNATLEEARVRNQMLLKGEKQDVIDLTLQYRPLNDARLGELLTLNRTNKAMEDHRDALADEQKTRDKVMHTAQLAAQRVNGYQLAPGIQQLANEQFPTTPVENLTNAQMKWLQSLQKANDTIKQGAASLGALNAEREKYVMIGVTAALADKEAIEGQKVLLSGNKDAIYAYETFHVIWRKLDQETKDTIANMRKTFEQTEALTQFANNVEGVFDQAFGHLNQGFKSFFASIVQGFEQMLQQMAAKYLASQLTKVIMKDLTKPSGDNADSGGNGTLADFLGGLLGGSNSGGDSGGSDPGSITGIPGMASGGLVAQDTPYLVGEHGPELMIPSRSGRIVPHAQTAAAMAGGGGGVHLTMNISTADANSFNRSQHQISADMSRMLQQANKRTGR